MEQTLTYYISETVLGLVVRTALGFVLVFVNFFIIYAALYIEDKLLKTLARGYLILYIILLSLCIVWR
jgi:hypothetical protein